MTRPPRKVHGSECSRAIERRAVYLFCVEPKLENEIEGRAPNLENRPNVAKMGTKWVAIVVGKTIEDKKTRRGSKARKFYKPRERKGGARDSGFSFENPFGFVRLNE